MEFAEDFRLDLPPGIRKDIDKKKRKFRNNAQINSDLQSKILEFTMTGASICEVLERYLDLCEEAGYDVDPVSAYELLISQNLFPKSSERVAREINRRLATGISLQEIMEDEDMRKILNEAQVNGLTSFIRMLSPDGMMGDIGEIIRRHMMNSADENKKELLEMKRGAPRPNKRKHPLGQVLVHYTNPGDCYDKEFDEEIRKRQPDWFKK